MPWLQQDNPRNHSFKTFATIMTNPDVPYAVIELAADYRMQPKLYPNVEPLRLARNLTITSANYSTDGYKLLELEFLNNRLLIPRNMVLVLRDIALGRARKTSGQGIPFFAGEGEGSTLIFDNVVRVRTACAHNEPELLSSLQTIARPATITVNNVTTNQRVSLLDQYEFRGVIYPGSLHSIDLRALVSPADVADTSYYAGYQLVQLNTTRICETYVSDECVVKRGGDVCVMEQINAYLEAQQAQPSPAPNLAAIVPPAVIGGVLVLAAAAAAAALAVRRRRRRARAAARKARESLLPVVSGGGGGDHQALSDAAPPPSKGSPDRIVQPSNPNSLPGAFSGAAGTIESLAVGSKGGNWELVSFHTAPEFEDASPDDKLRLGVLLGAGAFARVYRGTWRGVDVAVKVLQHDSSTAAAISNEVDLVMSFRHPNIVAAYYFVTWRRADDETTCQHDPAAAAAAAAAAAGGPAGGGLGGETDTAAAAAATSSSSTLTRHASASSPTNTGVWSAAAAAPSSPVAGGDATLPVWQQQEQQRQQQHLRRLQQQQQQQWERERERGAPRSLEPVVEAPSHASSTPPMSCCQRAYSIMHSPLGGGGSSSKGVRPPGQPGQPEPGPELGSELLTGGSLVASTGPGTALGASSAASSSSSTSNACSSSGYGLSGSDVTAMYADVTGGSSLISNPSGSQAAGPAGPDATSSSSMAAPAARAAGAAAGAAGAHLKVKTPASSIVSKQHQQLQQQQQQQVSWPGPERQAELLVLPAGYAAIQLTPLRCSSIGTAPAGGHHHAPHQAAACSWGGAQQQHGGSHSKGAAKAAAVTAASSSGSLPGSAASCIPANYDPSSLQSSQQHSDQPLPAPQQQLHQLAGPGASQPAAAGAAPAAAASTSSASSSSVGAPRMPSAAAPLSSGGGWGGSSIGRAPYGHRGPSTEAQTWLIFECCDGGTLQDLMLDQDSLGPRRHHMAHVLTLLVDIAAGMTYLHSRNVLHGDLKPGNVLIKHVQGAPYGRVAKVADFGLSRALGVGQSHRSTRTFGTLNHTPPELLRLGRLSCSGDIYAFGIIMWELFVGRVAFSGLHYGEVFEQVAMYQQRPEVPADMPPAYAELMRQCWSADPFARPAFTAVSLQLQAMLASLEQDEAQAQERFVADL